MRPEYRDDCLVNLVRSIEVGHQMRGPGAPPDSPYLPLNGLAPEELAERDKTVLLVIDGLGYNRLRRSRRAPALRAALRSSFRSVFPSTTASAVTSLLTGAAPLQHGLTGWFMWFGDIGRIITPLPYVERFGGAPLDVDPGRLFRVGPWWAKQPVPAYLVLPEFICDSVYSTAHGHSATRVAFTSLRSMFDAVLGVMSSHGPGPCHVHAYWPRFDSVSHGHGTWSEQAEEELARIDAAFERFLDACPHGEATVLLTADHGFVDSGPSARIALRDHPRLAATLARPLSGEPRVAYCALRPGAGDDFRAYVAERLGHAFECKSAAQLIEEHYFGLGAAHPHFSERVGDAVLIAHDDFVVGDGLDDAEPVFKLTGFHGGTSEDEMLVPLVVARP